MPAIEQNKLKRAGTGIRAVDHDRACPGFTLFAPMSGARSSDLAGFTATILTAS